MVSPDKTHKGPHRCWFSSIATGYALTCGGRNFGVAFARAFLRKKAWIKTTPTGMSLYQKHYWFERNDYWLGYERSNRYWFYDNIDQLLRSSLLVQLNGRN